MASSSRNDQSHGTSRNSRSKIKGEHSVSERYNIPFSLLWEALAISVPLNMALKDYNAAEVSISRENVDSLHTMNSLLP